jgi:hypothetical protein
MAGKARRRATARWGSGESQPQPTLVNPSTTALDRRALQAAARRQQFERERSATPVPARITLALNLRELYGPEVDVACGVVEPAVDQWETGELVATGEQIVLLAALTGFPVEFFYSPVEPGTTRTMLCGRGGLTICTETVDEHGVATVVFEDQPKRPRKPAAPKPSGPPDPSGPHRFVKDPATPVVCRVCQMPKANRRHRPVPGVAR